MFYVVIYGNEYGLKMAKKSKPKILEDLERIAPLLPAPLYWEDKNAVVLGANDICFSETGAMVSDAFIGKALYELYPKEMAEQIKSHNEMVMETKQTLSQEEAIEDISTKKIKYFTAVKSPLYDEDGEVIGIVGSSINITELKETQQQLAEKILEIEKAHRSNIEFMCMVSHEIRNPVGNILSFQSVMKELLESLQDCMHEKIFPNLTCSNKSELVEEVKRLFRDTFESHRISRDEALRSMSALENLGNLHRIQLQGVQPLWELRNIHKLIDEVIERHPEPSYNKVEFQINIDPSVPQEASIDYTNIGIALQILIRNAARFSHDKGRVKIKVETIQEGDIKKLGITIQDFGLGISEAQRKHLFDMLSHPEEALEEILYRKPSIQLPQAKMYIEAAGGSIDIKSALNQGTTVYITTPYRLPEERAMKPKESCRVLLIEDDPIAQQLTKNLLYKLGYHVNYAGSGEEAIELALKNEYDVALLDISLPDINGLNVMREIRSKKKDQIIFIAQTSHTSEEDEDRFISEGAMAILKKPPTKDELRNMIEAALVVKKNLN